MRHPALLITVLALLALPAAASANTLTVDPADGNNACTRGSDETCKTIAQAVAAAQGKDTIEIKPGTYSEAVEIPAGKDELIVKGVLNDKKQPPTINGAGTADTLSILSAKVVVQDLAIETPENAESAVAVAASDVRLERISASRTRPSTVAKPVIESTVGLLTVASSTVIQAAGPEATGSHGIHSAGAGGLVVTDTYVVAANGHGIQVVSGDNKLTRTLSYATAGENAGVHIASPGADGTLKKLLIDSATLSGGPGGAGLLAESQSGGGAGDIEIDGRHVTIAGSSKAVTLDSTASTTTAILGMGDPHGNITATFVNSILHGASNANQASGIPLLSIGNTATLTCTTACDTSPASEGDSGTINFTGATFTADIDLFVDAAKRVFLLRADAPLIDKAVNRAPEDSDKDIVGEAREVDGPDADTTAQGDIGADEFVNKKPTAIFSVTDKAPRSGVAVGFLSGATDPEQGAGGGIVEYRWDFGDGSTEKTPVAGVAHTYAQPGTYTATVTVVDKQGAVSDPATPITIAVRDGVPPTVGLTTPTTNQLLRILPRKVRGRTVGQVRSVVMRGTASDNNAVQSVDVAIRLVRRVGGRGSTRACRWLSGRSLVLRKCTTPVFRAARVTGTNWTFATARRAKFVAGLYEIQVRATDTQGVVSGVLKRTFRIR